MHKNNTCPFSVRVLLINVRKSLGHETFGSYPIRTIKL
nr:MAG TPA: hypothetical protein [Caudoviricetes sp.]